MRFGVLGPLAVWTDGGVPVTVPGVKVRSLLAALLIDVGRPVSADRLIDDLWRDAAPGNPSGALSAKVSQLRRALGDAEAGGRDLVVARRPGYVLDVVAAAVDAHRFVELTERARAARDPRTAAALLSEALDLWRGAAFADFDGEPFTTATAVRLEEQRLTAHEDLAEARLALGEHAALAADLGDLVAAHPLRERLRATHMRALYGARRQGAALDSYGELRHHLADELGIDPGVELAALHTAILTQDPALDAPAPAAVGAGPARSRTNLAAPLTDIIGRKDAVADVCDQLAAHRLVTLTGPGGVGKTRLAIAVARPLVDAYADGAWLVELAGLDGHTAADVLAETVMVALDIRDPSGASVDPTARLGTALAGRQALVVLDNCEHVLDPAAELCEALLGAAPDLRVLATSREPLGLPGEVLWDVAPLPVPDRDAADPAVVRSAAAVQLFEARAAAAAPGFALDDVTAGPVAVLCRRLDGIPLALELAATRVRTLGVHGVVERLDDRFRLLSSGYRGAPPRHRTLTAMIDWSWDLLTDPERVVLRRLAVHADGCTVAAAEAVCGGDDVPARDVLDLLARLVDRSLVVVVHGADEPRYRLLESVAAYCNDRLHEAGEAGAVRERHSRWYAALAERAAPLLEGGAQQRWLLRLDAEAANLRSAFDTAIAGGHTERSLRMAGALAWYRFLRGRLHDARRSLHAALSLAAGAAGRDVDAPAQTAVTDIGAVTDAGDGAAADGDNDVPLVLRARAQAWETGLALLQGETVGWAERRDAALAQFDGAGDQVAWARAAWFLSFVGLDTGGLAAGADLLDRALVVFTTAGDRWGAAATLVARAALAHSRGDVAALVRDGEHSAAEFAALGDRWGQLQATEWLAAAAELTADYARAEHQHREGLRRAEELGLWSEVARRLSWLGWIAMEQGDHARALACSGQALRLATDQGSAAGQVFAELGLAFAARRSGDLDLAERHLSSLRARAEQHDVADPLFLPMVLGELGFLHEQRGDAQEALELHVEAVDIALRMDAPRDAAGGLEGVAGALAALARDRDAARVLGAAAAARRATGLPRSPAEQAYVDRLTARVRDCLGTQEFDAAHAHGGDLTPAQACATVERATAGRCAARSVRQGGDQLAVGGVTRQLPEEGAS